MPGDAGAMSERAQSWQVRVTGHVETGLPGLPQSSGPYLGEEGMEQSVPPSAWEQRGRARRGLWIGGFALGRLGPGTSPCHR